MADPTGRDLQARGAGSHVDLADKPEQPAGVLPDTFLEKSMERIENLFLYILGGCKGAVYFVWLGDFSNVQT